LVQAQIPGKGTVSYTYDTEGIRQSSTVGEVTTQYLVDKNRDYAQVLEEWQNGSLAVSYVYGSDLISQERSGTQSFYLVDGLGSVVALADEMGSVTDTYTYQAFGTLISTTGEIENQYLFSGEQKDNLLDSYYLRDRFYDASTSRFIRRDSAAGNVTEPLTLQKYIYAHDNPVNLIDPSGFSSMGDVLATLNILSQLSARVLTFALNPVTIETAKAWAIIIPATAGALALVERQVTRDETRIRVVADPELDYRSRRRQPSPAGEDEQNMNSMRVQLQDAPGHTFGIPITNVPELGVTVGQVGQAVLAMWQYRRSLASWFPESHDTALIKGMAGVTKKAKDSYPFGVFQGSSQVYSRQWNENDSRGNRPVPRGYYRVDFENLRGHNLRNL
jgi:RHS repeat-associated protein